MEDFFNPDKLVVGAKGLVYIGSLLLVYRRDNKPKRAPLLIDVPGGGSDPGETGFETFQREVKEEFGLTINKENIVYAKRIPSRFPGEEGKFGYFAVAKLPDTAEKDIRFGDEGLEWMLMSEAEYLGHKDAWDIYRDRAKDYIQQ
jgi:8-oxo-dGTP diphosphatase